MEGAGEGGNFGALVWSAPVPGSRSLAQLSNDPFLPLRHADPAAEGPVGALGDVAPLAGDHEQGALRRRRGGGRARGRGAQSPSGNTPTHTLLPLTPPASALQANVRQLFPGLAIGTGIFVVACVIEALGGSKDKHH